MQPTIVLKRSSDEEEEEEEEEEFNLPVRKEEKRSFSLNQLIVGAFVLLCVGSFFFSSEFCVMQLLSHKFKPHFIIVPTKWLTYDITHNIGCA